MNCKELGYKVGDEFEVIRESALFRMSEKIKLIEDDDTCCPYFESLERDHRSNFFLTNIKPLEKTMDIKEAYKVMAQNCGIKVGDTVKVVRGFKEGELGCECGMADAKKYIGKEGVVKSFDSDDSTFGIKFAGGFLDEYYYPFFVLEKIKDGVKPIQISEDYDVHFKEGGTIEVGCQTIDFETVKKIYDRAKSTL